MSSSARLDGLRVLHVSTVHRVSDPRIRLKECRSLVDHGARVRLVARPSTVEVSRDGVEAVVLDDHRSRTDRILRGSREILRHVREFEPHIVHFHDPELLMLARFMRAPVRIYDVHESLPDLVLDRDWIPLRARRIVSRLCRIVEPTLARACSAFVFVDERWAPRFPTRPSREIRNPPLESEFPTVDRSAPPATPHVVYIGELLPERGVHSAVRSINALDSEAVLTLAGPVASDLGAELRKLDVAGRLRLPGLVDRSTVGALLASATAGLVLLEPVPAYDDATATKIHEYLGAGLPMILSDTTAHRRIAASSAAAVVVPYDNDDALTTAIDDLVSDHDHWRSLAMAAQRASTESPTWTTAAASLVELYEEIAPSAEPTS